MDFKAVMPTAQPLATIRLSTPLPFLIGICRSILIEAQPCNRTLDDLKDTDIRRKYREAHDKMKSQLESLESQFNSDSIENDDTLRLLPSELDLGAGY